MHTENVAPLLFWNCSFSTLWISYHKYSTPTALLTLIHPTCSCELILVGDRITMINVFILLQLLFTEWTDNCLLLMLPFLKQHGKLYNLNDKNQLVLKKGKWPRKFYLKHDIACKFSLFYWHFKGDVFTHTHTKKMQPHQVIVFWCNITGILMLQQGFTNHLTL